MSWVTVWNLVARFMTCSPLLSNCHGDKTQLGSTRANLFALAVKGIACVLQPFTFFPSGSLPMASWRAQTSIGGHTWRPSAGPPSEESRRCTSSTHACTTASPLPNETKAALSFLFKPLSPRIILARLKSFGKGGEWNEAWKIVQEMELWDG